MLKWVRERIQQQQGPIVIIGFHIEPQQVIDHGLLNVLMCSNTSHPSSIFNPYNCFFRCNLLVRFFLIYSFPHFSHKSFADSSSMTLNITLSERYCSIELIALSSISAQSSSSIVTYLFSLPNNATLIPCWINLFFILLCHKPKLILPSNSWISNLIPAVTVVALFTIVSRINPFFRFSNGQSASLALKSSSMRVRRKKWNAIQSQMAQKTMIEIWPLIWSNCCFGCIAGVCCKLLVELGFAVNRSGWTWPKIEAGLEPILIWVFSLFDYVLHAEQQLEVLLSGESVGPVMLHPDPI